MLESSLVKNQHAVALGRLGGSKGGVARAAILTAKERVKIARDGGLARAASLTAPERTKLARAAALARWRTVGSIESGADAPEAIRRLLKSYDPAALKWADPSCRYVIVRRTPPPR